jgi:hypothetical protein
MNTQNNNDGGPAFPHWETKVSDQYRQHYGMTMRDYFAGQALAGICASGPSEHWTDIHIASETYRIADAMLAAREEASQ